MYLIYLIQILLININKIQVSCWLSSQCHERLSSLLSFWALSLCASCCSNGASGWHHIWDFPCSIAHYCDDCDDDCAVPIRYHVTVHHSFASIHDAVLIRWVSWWTYVFNDSFLNTIPCLCSASSFGPNTTCTLAIEIDQSLLPS